MKQTISSLISDYWHGYADFLPLFIIGLVVLIFLIYVYFAFVDHWVIYVILNRKQILSNLKKFLHKIIRSIVLSKKLQVLLLICLLLVILFLILAFGGASYIYTRMTTKVSIEFNPTLPSEDDLYGLRGNFIMSNNVILRIDEISCIQFPETSDSRIWGEYPTNEPSSCPITATVLYGNISLGQKIKFYGFPGLITRIGNSCSLKSNEIQSIGSRSSKSCEESVNASNYWLYSRTISRCGGDIIRICDGICKYLVCNEFSKINISNI